MIEKLVQDLPELYQPVWGYPHLSAESSRLCVDRLLEIDRTYQALERLLKRPLKVLDLGCAQGFFSLSLAQRGAEVHGIDYLDKNIALCKALAQQVPELNISFTVGRIEDVVPTLHAGQYDLILGLSVFHHLIYANGALDVKVLLEQLTDVSGVLVLEMALQNEPLYWGPAQPDSPHELLHDIPFVHLVGHHGTHLAAIPRPLFIASKRYWVLNDVADEFEKWSFEPHTKANKTHADSRQYFHSKNHIVKHYSLTHPVRGLHNRTEYTQEIEFLQNIPLGFPAAQLVTFIASDTDAWIVLKKLQGYLLLDVIQNGPSYDSRQILLGVLEQLATLEAAGLYHNDVRTWNVLVDLPSQTVRLIDYGSVTNQPKDCIWPYNVFLAFLIFIKEVVTGQVDQSMSLRTIAISPFGLPEPYRSWAISFWQQGVNEWSFQKMLASLQAWCDTDAVSTAEQPMWLWMQAMEEAAQAQKQHTQNWISLIQAKAEQAEAKADQAEAKAEQAEAKAEQAEAKAEQAEAKAEQAEAKAEQAEAKAEQAEAKADQAEAKAEQAEAKAEQAEAKAEQVKQWSEFQTIENCFSTYSENRPLKTIAVDLTPILPAGENGGAKIFVLELMLRLAEMAPQTQFILLTQASSHAELATLNRPNMRRIMVVGPVVSNTLRPRLMSLASLLLPHFPVRLRGFVNRLGYKLNKALKRGGSGVLLRDMGVDLLFCPFTAPTYFEPGIPTVCTIYDLQYKTYPEFFSAEDVAHRERNFIEACRRAAALTAISDYSRDSVITHGNLDPKRIRTIHLRMAQRIVPGVENGKAILDRLGLVSRRYLVYPANFWKHKNHEMLLTAFGIACHERLPADIKLVCTGAPSARQAMLINAASTMNLGDRILFPGYLPNSELAVLMADSIGVVFPSLYEGFGLPVIEAMAAGVPVACSNTTSLPEVVAEAAILFDPRVPTQIAQAMISLVENDVLRAGLIQAGLQRVTEFSDTERMAKEYWDLFQYALSNEKCENLLTGIYDDGWAGPRMSIQLAPEASTQTLELEFLAPEWLPQSSITIQTTLRGNSQGAPLELQRGTSSVLSLAVDPVGGCYEVVIMPTFMPARSGHGADQRELSVLLQRCGIVRADGEYIELFPKKFSS